MSKAVLVLDEMPSCCEDCRFTDSGGDVCCLCNKDISEHEYETKKPTWCPLRELPEKKTFNGAMEEAIEQDCFDTDSSQDYTYLSGVVSGWNRCINEILGEWEE